MNWQKDLELAEKAARKAGHYLKKVQQSPLKIDSADGRDIKLLADKESEKIIIQTLNAASPYGFLAEESGEHGSLSSGDPIWVVDPLDGTVNFSRGIPLCCVSIGLWHESQPILGVVYNFSEEELFSGIVGSGAWCNNQAISVSNEDLKNKAILATGFPVNRDFESTSLQGFLYNIRKFKKIRLLGSAALSLAYVACGRVDAYTEEDIMYWDVAAGIALVNASGGWVAVENSSRNKWARNVKCSGNERIFLEL